MEVIDHETFDGFVKAIAATNVRVVKLADYGFTEPGSLGGGAVGMIGKVRLTATAFDATANVLHRWQKTRVARTVVTTIAGTDRGMHTDQHVLLEREQLRARLELAGFSVSEGEWTVETIQKLLPASR